MFKFFLSAPVLMAVLCFFGSNSPVSGSTGTSVTGSWASVSTWTIDGIHRAPNCGDTLLIPAGNTVTMNSQQNYSGCATPMVIDVAGTFQFTNGNKLILPCGSIVILQSTGLIKKATAGGGNSTLIDICGTVVWRAGDGPITGPDTLSGSTLPISLLYFEGKKVESVNHLTWSTASEINNMKFEVHRSLDGIRFAKIGEIEGGGNSNQQLNYSWDDMHPSQGINYYQLCQFDFDGASQCFTPIAINNNKAFSKEISAAFKDGEIIIYSPLEGPQRFNVQVTSSDGRIVHSSEKLFIPGYNSIPLSPYSTDLYFLRLTSPFENFLLKFIIQK